jgi:D-aspartate ligase
MRYGLSTCVEISDDPEVAQLGRWVLERMGFCGVAKVDFKRDVKSGRLYLLEVNPRYNLWHHPGAVAGVNIPALVYRDLTGPRAIRPSSHVARPGVRWMSARDDLRALREHRAAGQGSFLRWLWQLATADITEDFLPRDPLPGLLELRALLRRKLGTWPAKL